ncbi:MAG: serine protein kinase, partial [Acidobacteriota bacterium]
MTITDSGQLILDSLRQAQDSEQYRQQHWNGSFSDYLGIVRAQPQVTRSAYERLYDMILSYGTSEYIDNKKRIVHYHFFDDPDANGRDAVYGLDIPLMKLVNIFKSAAKRYGTEKRVILLHGPVGSAKSTIVRLLKRGLEAYSRTPQGALYAYGWLEEPGRSEIAWCPMNEEPLHLVPNELRPMLLEQINTERSPGEYRVTIEGDLCPYCRQQFRELMGRYEGDLSRIYEHVRVRRLTLSEKDRVGIGTFQPKDEKN